LWKENEQPSQLIGIIQDISQQKQAEAALHDSEEQLEKQHRQMQAVFDSVPGTVNLYDEQGSLVLWNRQFEEMSGYSAEELSHMSVTDWFKGDGNNPGVIPAAYVDGWTNSEALLLRKDGSTIPMYLAGASLEIGGSVISQRSAWTSPSANEPKEHCRKARIDTGCCLTT
jgi:PAS domain S-box-containing protein